jgi:hypothetical protein
VYVGSFKTPAEARAYGDRLIKRNLIAEFLVKTNRDVQALGRPRSTNRKTRAADPPSVPTPDRRQSAQPVLQDGVSGSATAQASNPNNLDSLRDIRNVSNVLVMQSLPIIKTASRRSVIAARHPDWIRPGSVDLPASARALLQYGPKLDCGAIPQSDPISIAFDFIDQDDAPGDRAAEMESGALPAGGMWVSGEESEGLERLRWIAGEDGGRLIDLSADGKVEIDRKALFDLSGARTLPPGEAAVRVARYISGNEGLLLMVQLAYGGHRYLLHIGAQARSLGGILDVAGSANLDNNYDSRINPYRRFGRKLDSERPPSGFDALVVINPEARWYNLRTNEFVPVEHITFHELAEAHAKIVLHLDYLEAGRAPGAHEIALAREQRLKSQRPESNIVLTIGSNRLLKTAEEVRQFHAQAGSMPGQRR